MRSLLWLGRVGLVPAVELPARMGHPRWCSTRPRPVVTEAAAARWAHAWGSSTAGRGTLPLATLALLPGSIAALTQPEISAAGVLLRPWQPADRPAGVAAYAEPDIQRWYCRSMSDDEARDWVAHWPGRWQSETGLGLHRVELAHSTANAASCRVARHAGFTAEGTKRSEARHADGWHDMHLHARIASDD